MRRLVIVLGCGLALLGGAAAASYLRAQRATTFLGTLPADVCPVGGGASLARTPAGHWAWRLAYGPCATPSHVGCEVYVAPTGGVAATNPADLGRRIDARRVGT